MIVWECDAYRKTVQDAVREFCETYWDKPRKHTPITPDGRFRLRDGNATYCCRFIDNIPGIYRITRGQE